MYLWIDVDCFECQVWSQKHPELLKSPLMIVSAVREHGIYSFDYEAKSYGISRRDTVDTAKAKCPSLTLYKKSTCGDELDRMRDKIELSIKRFITEEFENQIQLQMEGLEEGYLKIGHEVDLKNYDDARLFGPNLWTENTKWIVGDVDSEVKDNDDLSRLKGGVNILAEILRRLAIDTGLVASGSIGDTKLIARLACHLNKPRGITVVGYHGLEQFFTLIKILDVPGLKGKTGDRIIRKWKKPNGSELETLLDFKNYVPVKELISEGYVRKNNLDARALIVMCHKLDIYK